MGSRRIDPGKLARTLEGETIARVEYFDESGEGVEGDWVMLETDSGLVLYADEPSLFRDVPPLELLDVQAMFEARDEAEANRRGRRLELLEGGSEC